MLSTIHPVVHVCLLSHPDFPSSLRSGSQRSHACILPSYATVEREVAVFDFLVGWILFRSSISSARCFWETGMLVLVSHEKESVQVFQVKEKMFFWDRFVDY